MLKTKYFISDYFQKSLKLLFPLISKNPQTGLINTYLLADNISEDINDYYLLVEIEKNVILNEDLEKYLYSLHETIDNTELLVFDLHHINEEVDKFLTGSYSEYSSESKEKILKHFNWKIPVIKAKELFKKSDVGLHYYVFLYPDKFKNEYAEEIYNTILTNNGLSLFEKKDEAIKVVKTMKELCPIYDVIKETFTKQIKQ